MTMTDNAHRPGRGADADRAANDPDRLAEYQGRTRDLLDLLALATLWLVVVPPGDFGHGVTYAVIAFRIALSALYGADLAIRSSLAPRHMHYALTHPVALISVFVPTISPAVRRVDADHGRGQPAGGEADVDPVGRPH